MSRLLNRLRSIKLPKTKLMIYSSGTLLATGFCVSSLSLNATIMAEYSHYQSVEEHFHLLENLQKLAPKIDATKMLNEFLSELKSSAPSDGLFTAEFVKQLFVDSGIKDSETTQHLIDIMDWNKNGKLTKYEVAALFTLFNVGTDVERFKFLFSCLDLNKSGSVYKDEFRQILTCLLEAKYHIYGLENDRDPDELYKDITPDDYHTMAKFRANQLVRKIFTWADQKKRGKLSWTQFSHWCYRGDNDVRTLKELLYQTHDDSDASGVYRKYTPGKIIQYPQHAPSGDSYKPKYSV